MDESSFPSLDLVDYDMLFSEFINYPELEISNDERGLLHTSTPLEPSNSRYPVYGTIGQDTSASPRNLSVALYTSGTPISSFHQNPPYDLPQRNLPSHHLRRTLHQKRPLGSDAQNPSDLPGLNCWSVSGENLPTRQSRPSFTKKRKLEVKNIRDLGACLRCRRVKQACSGSDPCERCTRANQSKSLNWVECIRPSFDAVNIFAKSHFVNGADLVKADSNENFNFKDPQNSVLPFDALHVTLRPPALVHLILNNPHTDRYVISSESIGSLTGLICYSLGNKVGTLCNALVYLSVHLYAKPAATDLYLAREQAASTLLREIEARVKPSRLQSAQRLELDALLLVLLIAIITYNLRCEEVHALRDPNERKFSESKGDALERLLCYHVANIVQKCSLFYQFAFQLDIGEVAWTFPGHISAVFSCDLIAKKTESGS